MAMVVQAGEEEHTKRQVGAVATVVPMVATGNLLEQILEPLVEPGKEQQPENLVRLLESSMLVAVVGVDMETRVVLEAKAVGKMALLVIVTKPEVALLILGEVAEVLHFMKIKVLQLISILALVALG